MVRKRFLIVAILVVLLCCFFITGCGENDQNSPETPTKQLMASDSKFVFIALDECYPPEQSTMMICRAEDKKRENPTVLTYDESISGYGILLEEGSYEIALVCDAPNVTYSQSRYIVVDQNHSYYHIRFTSTAYQDFD